MPAIIFDTETTGGADPKMIEAAGIILLSPEDIDLRASFRICERYNPGVPSVPGALATHHILDEDLVDAPHVDLFNIGGWFPEPADFEYLIGQNVDYDWRVIGEPDCKRIDTLALARRFYPELESHTLGALAYSLLPPATARDLLKGKAHGAAADCEVLRHVLLKLLPAVKKVGFPLTWDGLWRCSEAARIPSHFPFGKHKGELISELPRDYIDWALRNLTDMDDYLRRALSAVIM